jgi:CheY-like chemotaxis protein
MTEQKTAEHLFISEQKRAEEANRAKSNFLAAMSHEIRTPMNAILGMADLLWETELNRLQREYVGRFRRAGTNLLTLINDILDLSKIESGRFELESVNFSLADLIERTLELINPRASTKGIDLSARIAPGTPSHVVGDPGRLQQILNNIVGNAVKFTEKGSVSITVEMHPDNQLSHLQFTVTDTGVGIPADNLTSIFEDFIQAESSTTRRFGGTGLGLGICQRLVTRMGGHLTAQSVFGEGSTFVFDVILREGEQTLATDSLVTADFSGHRVLVVDDDSTNSLILSNMCVGWGMTSMTVANPSEACEMVRAVKAANDRFSLVLLDRVMPGSSGLDTLEKLIGIDPSLSVIITSSDSQPGDLTKAKAIGAAGYLTRPVRSADLLTLIRATLRERRKNTPDRREDCSNTPEDHQQRARRMRILIAEDSEDNRFLLAAYLEGQPYELTFAENGQLALEAFSSHAFDLVLMDVYMPVMDGLTAAAKIRARELERSAQPTPIVALTANALIENVEQSRVAGCNTHLSKPVSKEKLISVIESFRTVPANPESKSLNAPAASQRGRIDIPKGFEKLSRNYIAARQKEVSLLQKLPPGEGLDDLRVFGHNIKGTGVSFGFPELTRLGAALEQAAKEANTAQLADHLFQVGEYVEYAVQTLL